MDKIAAAAVVIGLACIVQELPSVAAVRGELATTHYARARAALSGAREAGYLTDEPLDHDEGAYRFHRAAYGVAPVLLRPQTKPRVLLVDLARPALLTALLRAPDLALVADLGGGLAVVERK